MTATTTPAREHLTIYPTTDQLDYNDQWIAGGAFHTLRAWAIENGLHLEHDPESDATVTGYYIRDENGNQVAAATLTDH